MTELLTESFCERCGTRFELGSLEPMTRSQKTRGLVSGLRSFIMSTDSLSDSINDAMRAEEEQIAARQVEAFQEAFNFCLDCRRYTCVSCWNDDAGRCRSCVPVPGLDDLAGYDQRVARPAFLGEPVEPVDTTPLLTSAEEPTWPTEPGVTPPQAWPEEDAGVVLAAAEAEEVVIETPDLEIDAEPIAVAAEANMPVEEPAGEPIAAAAEAEPGAEERPALPPPTVVPGFAAAEPEAVLAADASIEPAVPEPEPEPLLPPAAGPKRDLRDTFVRGPLVPRPAGREPAPETLAARQSQLDILGIDDPGEGTVSIGQRDALPYRSSGAGSAPNSAALAAIWDASSRYLEAGAQRASLTACGSCGLTVSSTARFCRRCGAPQTLSA
jgi:hypothetical protein